MGSSNSFKIKLISPVQYNR